MDTRTLKVNNKYRELYFDTPGGGKHIVTGEFCEADVAPELVKRWNAYHVLVEALNGLVQSIEFQAEANFLNEDADEGEENALTRARQALKAAQQ